jgi:hypothetical protein
MQDFPPNDDDMFGIDKQAVFARECEIRANLDQQIEAAMKHVGKPHNIGKGMTFVVTDGPKAAEPEADLNLSKLAAPKPQTLEDLLGPGAFDVDEY